MVPTDRKQIGLESGICINEYKTGGKGYLLMRRNQLYQHKKARYFQPWISTVGVFTNTLLCTFLIFYQRYDVGTLESESQRQYFYRHYVLKNKYFLSKSKYHVYS